MGSTFETNYLGTTAGLKIEKGILKFNAKSSSLKEGYYPSNRLAETSLGSARCKNGQTFSQLLNSLEITTNIYLQEDASLKHKASFSMQGSQSPFNYNYTQKSTGVMKLLSKCSITGNNTSDIANDKFTAACKADQIIKLSINAKISGELDYY